MRTAGASTRRAAAIAILCALISMPLAAAWCDSAFAQAESASPVTEIVPETRMIDPDAAAPMSNSSYEPSSIEEIPRAVPINPPRTFVDTNGEPDASGAAGSQSGNATTDQAIEEYEASQNPGALPAPHFHSLQEFMNEAGDRSPIGLELREDRRRLNTGEEADGLLITMVHQGSPAADANLHAYSATGHAMLEGAAIAAAMVFPPAILAIAIVDETHFGESYDMIIGVDGKRVTNYLDFEDQMRDVKPGDVVYLSIVRNGKRMQVPVHIPANATTVAY